MSLSLKNDVSRPLRDIPVVAPESGPAQEVPRPLGGRDVRPDVPADRDPVVQRTGGGNVLPGTIQSFDGLNNVNGVLPPDTNGEVGPNHYVQMVNVSFAVFSKTGTLLLGPTATNTIWQGFGGLCETTNRGDPIVLYDQLSDRWVLSQFAFSSTSVGPFLQCIAVSTTGDPTGSYFRYAFQISATKLNDYPKLGVWPDGYYMTVNQFTNLAFSGVGAVAFERQKMLTGQAAKMVYFDLATLNDPGLFGMQPSDLDGLTLPPGGAPNTFLNFDATEFGEVQDQLEPFDFHVDWANPASSTFTSRPAIATAAFDPILACGAGGRDCIPQPGTAEKLDALNLMLMFRLAYRNFGTHETLVVNHTVDADVNHAGVRWYELRKSGGGNWGMQQQGTFAPDAEHRWMGSAAMDNDGDIIVGYSTSSSTLFPSIRGAGRLAGDPLGQLAQGEGIVIAGGGSQTHTASRWGDYSDITVDPNDDCTFWYTTEYYSTTSVSSWRTRIASFAFPSVHAPGAALCRRPVNHPRNKRRRDHQRHAGR